MYMYVCICTYVYVCVYVCVYMYVCVCMYMYVCMYVCICMCVYVCMYVYVCVCIHVYVCMHNILGELFGGNVLPQTGGELSGEIVRGRIVQHPPPLSPCEHSWGDRGVCRKLLTQGRHPVEPAIAESSLTK